MNKNTKFNAHRGFRSLYPENTLIAFQKAAELPEVYAIEFDVHPTKDGKLVITHDDTVDRCSNGHGKVRDFTFDELRQLDFGSWKAPEFAGTRIPALEETLETIYSIRKDIYIMLEIKEDDDECTKKALEVCRKYNVFANGHLISFKPRQLQLVREIAPEIKLQGFPLRYLAKHNGINPPDDICDLYYITCLWTGDATAEEIAGFHRRGIKMDICPVDTEEQLLKVLPLDIESITSNAPDVIIPLLKKYDLR